MSTINDVAKLAGVSAATVSHVVNKTRFVSPKLVEKVEAAIASLDSPPNFILRKRESKVKTRIFSKKYIVFLTSDLQNPFNLALEKSLKKQLEITGYMLVTLDCSEKINWDFYVENYLSSEYIAGVFISSELAETINVKKLDDLNFPVVNIGYAFDKVTCDNIESTNFEGSYNATVHLIRSGHSEIAFVCGDESKKSNIERLRGFEMALKDNKIKLIDNFVIKNISNEEDFFSSLKNLLLQSYVPTAIFVANYKNIVSMFKFMEMSNIVCPKDLSVIGYNDFEWAPLLNPPLTTIAQDTVEISKNSVRILLDRIEENKEDADFVLKKPFETIEIHTELKVRGSTRGIGRGPFGERAASVDEIELSEEDIKRCVKGNYTAAISFHYTGKEWMRLHELGIRDVFDSLNISVIAVTDAHFDPELQIKQLDSLSTLEPDILISVPTDDEKTSVAFKKISKSNIKLILITNVPKGLKHGDYESCVSVNERSHGRFMGRGLGEYMTRHKTKNIGLIRYGASFYATNQRDSAAEQILLEEFSNLNICGEVYFNSEEEAYEKTIELLKYHPEIEGLYVSWEGPAQQVINALMEINRQDIAISTADLEHNMALSMAKGSMVKAISTQNAYEQGRAMALCAANSLLGKKIPDFIGIEPLYVNYNNLLKSWEKIYRASAPEDIIKAMKES